jgi:hypothetical protein
MSAPTWQAFKIIELQISWKLPQGGEKELKIKECVCYL